MDRRRFLKTSLVSLAILPGKTLLETALQESEKRAIALGGKRRRIRELGLKIGSLETGPHNAITDINGVRVGHSTIIKGQGKDAVRTGVTVILPHSGNTYEENLFASCFIQNGWGEMTGIAALENTGLLKTPIFLTGTYNVGIVQSAATKYLCSLNPAMAKAEDTAYPVVAECFDDFLSNVQSRQISERDVLKAVEDARGGPVTEGAVGGGTGMTSFGFKGGIGTSSRRAAGRYTVGVLVMTNTATREQLRIDGVPVGRQIVGFEERPGRTKSIILIAATDAPLLPFQLKKIGKRVVMGLAQVGAISRTTSGDIILAFSTGNKIPRTKQADFNPLQALNDFALTPLYQAAVEATQEAIINALAMAETMVGLDGNISFGLPLDQVDEIMKKQPKIRVKSNG
jgi:D-aminopeptidase